MQPRRRLVEQVDGLVGEKAVVYIAHGQLVCGVYRVVADLQLVVLLQHGAQAAEHFEGLRPVRLRDMHGLKAALQRGVLLDVAAVLLRRRGSDYLHLAAAERRLEDVCRIDGTLGAARADYRVQLVDEQYHVPRAADILQD